MNNGDIITFDAKKNFTFIKPLGTGGTGDTHLFRDDTTDMQFAIKKYVPKDKRYIDDHYRRFVDEIKILFNISHRNIVRIYNYYLFPSSKTGYLQMEYIDGVTIDKFESYWYCDWNDIFTQTISAFQYLEDEKILHRDIRATNILVDTDDTVKIIDFGFGKQLDPYETDDNSVLLNWPVTEMPNEVQLHQEYTHKTEIYFVGVLFKKLAYSDNDFRHAHIIEKMTKMNPDERYNSFADVAKDITAGVLSEIDFSDQEKEIYQCFADNLVGHITLYLSKYAPVDSIYEIKVKLADMIRNSSLEDTVQDNRQLIKCFINSAYKYNSTKNIKMHTVVAFYEMLTRLSDKKQKILYNNIFNRLANIPVKVDEYDDLPF